MARQTRRRRNIRRSDRSRNGNGRAARSANGSSRKVRYAVVGLGHIAQVAVLPAFRNAYMEIGRASCRERV